MDETYLVDHVALWMPTFISHVSINLHKLLQDRAVTACTLGRKTSGVVEMTVHIAVVLVIGVLRSEECRTYRACEVLNMEFLVCKK